MTEKANPSINRTIGAFKTAGAIAYAGSTEGFISPAGTPTEISQQDGDIAEGNLNAFDETSSGSSLDVTIDGGEAFVFGSWLAIDTTTTVSLDASTAGQTVYVGWNKDGSDDVIVGVAGDFASASGDADQKIPLWTFDTDGSGVTAVTDERSFDQISADSVEQGAGSGLDADTLDGLQATELGLDVAEDGTIETNSSTELDFTTGITAVDDGDNTSTVRLTTDGVTETELDQTITPTWSGEHTFSAGITGLPAPSGDSDAARKAYVDSVAEGLDVKEEVVVCTCGQGNIDLSSSTDPNPVDGVTLSDGDRVLLIEQTDATENGIYVASTATDPTTWSRAPDADEDSEVSSGMFVFTIAGDTSGNTGFILITDDPITLGTTALDFTRFNGTEELNAGSGIDISGTTISHIDTSSQSDLVSASGSAITELTFDTFGHVTGATASSFDGRYLNTSGDSLTGVLDLNSNNLEDGATTIWDSANGYVPQSSIEQGAGSGLDADRLDGNDSSAFVSASGDTITGEISVSGIDLDGSSITDSSRDFLSIGETGDDIRLPTGQAIEDGGGNRRFRLGTSETEIINESGDGSPSISLSSSTGTIEASVTSSWTIRDANGAFDGVQYITASSAPGTLQLSNADLDIPGALFSDKSTGDLDIGGEITENASL